MYSKMKNTSFKNLDPEDIFLKYKFFDYEMYIDNYCLRDNGGYDDKNKAWTHYLLYGESQELIFFDITNKGKYETMKNNFDYELYIANYNLIENGGYDNFDKAWWHYVNIGERNKYIYFDINKREEYNVQRNNFDFEKYLNKYFYLKEDGYDTYDKAWWHYMNIGKNSGLFYFNIKDKNTTINKYKKNILFCISNCSDNNNIKIFVKNISNIIGNYYLECNLFMVIIDEKNQNFRLLNDNELNMFYNNLNDNNILNKLSEKKINLFNQIKNNKDTIIFVSELYPNEFLTMDLILRKSRSFGMKTISVYHDCNFKNTNEYISLLSKFDIIIPCNKNNEDEYIDNRIKYKINKKQIIKEFVKNKETNFDNMTINTWYNYTQKIYDMLDLNIYNEYLFNINNTIYFYLDIHNKKNYKNISYQLALQFINNYGLFENKIIFVKWNNIKMSLVPHNIEDLLLYFEIENNEELIKYLTYQDYSPIHYNEYITFHNSLFFCPETNFNNIKIVTNLPSYLVKHNIKCISIFNNNKLENDINNKEYKLYFFNILLNSIKIIPVSNYSKMKLIDYCINKGSDTLPNIKSILLPLNNINMNNYNTTMNNSIDIITIVVPGNDDTIEEEILFFNELINFINNNHHNINIQIISYGHNFENSNNIETYYKFNDLILKFNGKLKFNDIQNDEEISKIYFNATFSLIPNSHRGFNFDLTQSLCNKVPALISCNGSNTEISELGGCYIINTNNSNVIYNALEDLILNPDIISNLKEQIVPTNYDTWFDYAEKIYREIIPYFNN